MDEITRVFTIKDIMDEYGCEDLKELMLFVEAYRAIDMLKQELESIFGDNEEGTS